MGIGNHESDIGRDGSDICDVICNSFEFEEDGAKELCTRRNFDLCCPLDGLAECGAVGECRIARNTLGQKHGAFEGEILEELEVARLDDAGMNRADRNLKDALSVGRPVEVPLPLKWGQHGVERKALAQRMHVRPVIVERHATRIRMPYGFEAEPILNLSLLPVDGW